MTKQARNIRQAISIAILLGAASAAAFANESPLFSAPQTPLCYCHCQHPDGKPCTKMCELPQYENRWWATSCHKKTGATAKQSPSAPAPNSGSRKTNRMEEAKL